MLINKINNITFQENSLSRDMKSADAILMLRDANASVKFKQSQEFAKKADSVDSNPIVALGYKLYRTFHVISDNDYTEKIDVIA